MNNRTLEIAALLLIAWAMLQYDPDEIRHRVVVSGPASHLGWEDADSDAALENEEFDRDHVDADADVDEPTPRMRWAEARRLTREERLRLRSEIREQLDQARQEAWRTKTQWRTEYGDFRDAHSRIREEIKRDIRENLRGGRDEFREFRDEIREFRNQVRELRNEIRESVRDAVRIRREKKDAVRMDHDDN